MTYTKTILYTAALILITTTMNLYTAQELMNLYTPQEIRTFKSEQVRINREFMSAIKESNMPAIQKCLENGANVNTKNDSGECALSILIIQGKTDQALSLLQNENIMVNNCNPDTKNTPLHWAFFEGNKKIILALLEKGANIQAENSMKQTPQQMQLGLKMKEKLAPITYS